MPSWPTKNMRRIAATLAVAASAGLGAVGCYGYSESFSGPIDYVIVQVLPIGSATHNLKRGITVQLRAVPANADSNWVDTPVTWSSSDDAKATVDANGVVTTKAGGIVEISATSGGKTGTFELGIQFPVGTVTIKGNVASIRQEGAVQLSAEVKGTDGVVVTDRTVTWTSSNPAVATVSGTGFVAGLTNGQTTITATAEGVSGTAVVTVQGSPVIATVTVAPPAGYFDFFGVGQVLNFTQTPKAGSGTVIGGTTPVWASSNTAVATVTQAGVVTMAGAGKATITATVDNGLGTNVVGSLAIEAAPQLTKGVAAAVPTMAATTFYLWAYIVPAGATSISVTTTGGTGDADLFLFYPGLTPTGFNGSNYPPWTNHPGTAYRSGNSGNAESVSTTLNLPGVWRVYNHAWGGGGTVTGLTVTATHTP